MSSPTHYLNTDLELTAPVDLQPLVSALEIPGPLHLLTLFQREDGTWFARLGTWTDHDQPEMTIHEFIDAIELLSAETQILWEACNSREFDVGYECGSQPNEVSHAISPSALARMTALGLSLRITLYCAAMAAPA